MIEEDEPFEGVEVDGRFRDVGRRVLWLKGRPLRREGPESRHVLLVIEDVAGQKELEAELSRKARELQRSDVDLSSSLVRPPTTCRNRCA